SSQRPDATSTTAAAITNALRTPSVGSSTPSTYIHAGIDAGTKSASSTSGTTIAMTFSFLLQIELIANSTAPTTQPKNGRMNPPRLSVSTAANAKPRVGVIRAGAATTTCGACVAGTYPPASIASRAITAGSPSCA